MGRGLGDAWVNAWSWPVFGLAACLSTFFAARIGAKAPGMNVWRIAQAAMALGIVLPALTIAPAALALVASALCVGGTFMVVTMVGMQVAKQYGGIAARRLMAAMTAAFATGQLAGPLTVPYAVGPGGDFSTILIVATAALVLGICLLPFDAKSRAPGGAVIGKGNT
jgi:hypothetical protein